MTVGERDQGDLAQPLAEPRPARRRSSSRSATRSTQITYDVDRKPLGFELKLDDFDVGFEPGTEQATQFVSKVRLTDKSRGDQGPAAHDLDEPPARPSRLHLLPVELHAGCIDPHTDQSTGRFQSIFQVAINPGRPIIYVGLPAGRPGRVRPVLHEGGDLHRRWQERARARRRQGKRSDSAKTRTSRTAPAERRAPVTGTSSHRDAIRDPNRG